MASEVGFGRRIRIHGSEEIPSSACGAVLEIEAGKRTEMMFHMHNQKILYVLSGKVDVLIIKNGMLKKKEFGQGESISVSPGLVHQIEAKENSVVIDFGTDDRAYMGSDPLDVHIIERGTPPQPKEIELTEEEKKRVAEAIDAAKKELVDDKQPKPEKPATKKKTKRKTKKKKATKKTLN
jgi:quercetin dioxygenase-like cupin family protein